MVMMEFSGPVDKDRSNRLYFEYVGNPDVSNIQPKKLLNSLVTSSFAFNPLMRCYIE